MKTLATIMIVFFLAGLAYSQDVKKIDKSIELQPGDKLVIDLAGEVNIETSYADQVQINTIFIQKGKIIGWSNRDKRKKYDVEFSRVENTVTLKRIKLPSLGMLGISWYREDITHYIKIPDYVDVFVKMKYGDIKIKNANFKNLNVEHYSGKIYLDIPGNNIRAINCTADDGKLYLDDERIKGDRYSKTGTGESVITVFSSNGKIYLKLNSKIPEN